MPITPVTLSPYTYQDAAANALFGKLRVPPSISPAECRAYLLSFTKPAHEDRRDSPDYHHGVLIIAGGGMGRFDTAACAYASDARGSILVDDDERWIPLADPVASPTPLDPADYLRRAGLHV